MNKTQVLLAGISISLCFSVVKTIASEIESTELKRQGSIALQNEDRWGENGPIDVRKLQGLIMESANAAKALGDTYYAPESRQAKIFYRLYGELQNMVEETEAMYLLRRDASDQGPGSDQKHIDNVNRVTKPGDNKAAWNYN